MVGTNPYCRKQVSPTRRKWQLSKLQSEMHHYSNREGLARRLRANDTKKFYRDPMSWEWHREWELKRKLRKIEHEKQSLIDAEHRRARAYIHGRRHHTAEQREARRLAWNKKNEGVCPPITSV